MVSSDPDPQCLAMRFIASCVVVSSTRAASTRSFSTVRAGVIPMN
jgi:hypothetical protein